MQISPACCFCTGVGIWPLDDIVSGVIDFSLCSRLKLKMKLGWDWMLSLVRNRKTYRPCGLWGKELDGRISQVPARKAYSSAKRGSFSGSLGLSSREHGSSEHPSCHISHNLGSVAIRKTMITSTVTLSFKMVRHEIVNTPRQEPWGVRSICGPPPRIQTPGTEETGMPAADANQLRGVGWGSLLEFTDVAATGTRRNTSTVRQRSGQGGFPLDESPHRRTDLV
jgi:hypothetical protein